MSPQRTVRVVHLDPDGFADLSVERELFESELDAVSFETIDCSGPAISTRVEEADVLLTHYATVPAEAMNATDCSVIGRYATGVDGIDVEAATERGVAVTNVPTYCDEEVGEHIVTLALAILRGLPAYTAATREGAWDWRDATPVRTAADSTFGCFAFGRKARAAVRRADALGFDVIAHDPYLSDEEIRDGGATPVSFDDLLARSDVLSLNAPLTDETEGLFDAEVFARMREDAILINTSRGRIVDEEGLIDALETGPLYGAGLDVLASEPPRETNPLLDRDDVVVTPHAAWYSDGALDRVRRRGTLNAIAAWRSETVDGVVNPAALR
ncbi:C-terminal binding protein [Halosolutus amylolyticus]|uniref:C-terminal binding protein n=1 Tax=Halosolutus amylolyticus TaxID=2932267 RepID=A0ABD5PKY4_9EURY|nr:C-terminal binding protein [Halosolutus amylolyticus]